MKHGRKEQFSVTISQDVATEFYNYMEKHGFVYKNQAFERLIKEGLNNGEFMKKYDENIEKVFKEGTTLAFDLATHYSKATSLKKAIKVHYNILEDLLDEAKKRLDIA